MANIILKGDDFVGIADDQRRAILEAERAAAAMGVLPDEKDKRDAIVNRLKQRLANANKGWGFNQEETVVRVDDRGVAHIIPKEQATGWMKGLPAHKDTRDRSSRHARQGRQTNKVGTVAFDDPGRITPVDPRVAAQRFHQRISEAIQRTGTIPRALQDELIAEGWRMGQPVPSDKVYAWCSRFQVEWHNKYNGRA